MRQATGNQVHVSRRGGEPGNDSPAESGGALRRPPNLEDLYVFHRSQVQPFQQFPRGHVGGAAEAADADGLSFQVFGRLDAVEDYKLVGQYVDHAAHAHRIGAAHRGVGDATASGIAHLNVLRDDGRDTDGRAPDIHEVYVEAVFFVETRVLSDGPHLVDGIRRAVGELNFFLGFRCQWKHRA